MTPPTCASCRFGVKREVPDFLAEHFDPTPKTPEQKAYSRQWWLSILTIGIIRPPEGEYPSAPSKHKTLTWVRCERFPEAVRKRHEDVCGEHQPA